MPSPTEIDLRPALAALRRRLALVAVCVAVGAGAGFLAAGPASQLFEGRTVIFVGATSGLSQPLVLTALAHATGILAPVAARAHLRLARLETSIAAAPLGGVQSTSSTGPATRFFEIKVSGPRGARVLLASRLLGSALIGQVERYQSAEIAADTERLHTIEREQARLSRQIGYQSRLPARPGEAFVKLGTLGALQDAVGLFAREATDLRLRLAELTQADHSQIVSSSARLESARTRVGSTLVAGSIGLLLGVLAALTLPPLRLPSARTRR